MLASIFIKISEVYPAWVVAVLLVLTGLSFMARHRAQYKYGRIREYGWSAYAVASVFVGLGLLYFVSLLRSDVSAGTPAEAVAGWSRAITTMLCLSCIAFNWGGVRSVFKDVRRRFGKGNRVQ